MPWRKRETWIVAILAGLVANYLAALLNTAIPVVLAWIAEPAGINTVAALIPTGMLLAWLVDVKRQTTSTYTLREHFAYMLAPLYFIFFGDIKPMIETQNYMPAASDNLPLSYDPVVRRLTRF